MATTGEKPRSGWGWIVWVVAGVVLVVVGVVAMLMRSGEKPNAPKPTTQPAKVVWDDDPTLKEIELKPASEVPGDEQRRVSLAGGDLTLIPPGGWVRVETPPDNLLAAFEGPGAVLRIARAPSGWGTMRSGLDAARKHLAGQVVTNVLLEEGYITVDGQKAFVLRCLPGPPEQKALSALYGFHAKDGRVFVIEFVTPTESYDNLHDVFDRCVMSVRVP